MKGDSEANRKHRKTMAKIHRAARGEVGRSPLPHYVTDKDGHLVARTPPPHTLKPRKEDPLIQDYEPGATEEP